MNLIKLAAAPYCSRGHLHRALALPPLLEPCEPFGTIAQGNHNFGTTSHCRVPLKSRAGQLRITPDVQIGCISCASTDGRFGGPVWCGGPP